MISRGSTATMLRQDLSIPVIEIELSMYDILCAIRLTDGMDGKIAVVSAANIAESAQQLCTLMNYDIDVYTYASQDTPGAHAAAFAGQALSGHSRRHGLQHHCQTFRAQFFFDYILRGEHPKGL